MSQFLQELRRRGVIRVMAAYLVAAWIAIQVASTVTPELGLPSYTTKLVIIISLVMLPVVLVLAWMFDFTRTGIERTSESDAAAARSPAPRIAVAVLVIAVIGIGAWFGFRSSPDSDDDLDPHLIAVLPFRVSGPPGLEYLEEGLIDLIAVKFTGTERAVEPRTALAAWKKAGGANDAGSGDVATDVARSLRAAKLLSGSVVSDGARVTLNMSLTSVRDDREITKHSDSAPTDSVSALVDRVVAAVLSLEAGESQQRLALLTATPLPALRAYLAGNVQLRAGDYSGAVQSYMLALDIDSTFAVAALNVPDAVGMLPSPNVAAGQRAARVLQAHRDRLNSSDRAFVDALYPPVDARAIDRYIARWERLSRELPERPDVWYRVGDGLFHYGAMLGIEDYMPRARAAFERARVLDPSYFIPLQHLIWIAHLQGDTAFVARNAEEYLAAYPGPSVARNDLVRRLASVRHDTAAMRQASDVVLMDEQMLASTVVLTQIDPTTSQSIDTGRKAANELMRGAATEAARGSVGRSLHMLEMNAGRPRAAANAFASPADDPAARDRRLILDALFWDGDTLLAGAAAGRLRRTNMTTAERCALDLWRAARDVDGTNVLAANDTSAVARTCMRITGLLDAHRRNTPDVVQRLQSLDSLLRTSPHHRDVGNIVVARIYQARGDQAAALAAAGRRIFTLDGQTYFTTFLELEGTSAAALGKKQEAASAFAHYLRLRADPEPALLPKVERVRAELARLSRERN